MKSEITNGTLVITHSSHIQVIVVSAIAATLPLVMLFQQTQGTLKTNNAIAMTVTTIIIVGVALLSYCRSKLVFDKNTQIVSWHKKRLWSSNDGQASFSDISNVKVTNDKDSEAVRWRAVLVINAKDIPVTEQHVQSQKQAEETASQINDFVGRTANQAAIRG